MISIIIVNYHCAALTWSAVESVLNESTKSEIIVVDNSTDTLEALQLKKLLPATVTLIINQENEGFAKACNRAYSQSRGNLILLLNPDAYLLPGSLSILKQTLENQSNCGAVGPTVYWDEKKKYCLPSSIFPSPWWLLRSELFHIHPFLGQIHSLLHRYQAIRTWLSTKKTIRVSALSGGHVLIKRSAIEKIGGLFDDRFFMYYEDSDLMLRLKRANYCLFIAPQAECVHRYEHSTNKIQLMSESALLYFEKNHHNHWYLSCASWLIQKKSISLSLFTNLGTIDTTLKLPVPDALHFEWLLEISPSPYFTPSIGHFGKGDTAEIPFSSLQLLHSGHYFCRIGSLHVLPRHMKLWQWETK